MALIETRELSAGYSGEILLDKIDLRIEAGQRVCLVGRNGAGKSTLLKILAGTVKPISGQRLVQTGTTIAMLEQQVPGELEGSVFHVVADGLGEVGKLLDEYHDVTHQLQTSDDPKLCDRLDAITNKLHASDGWRLEQLVETTLTKLSLDGDATFASLSAGMKRRVLLARALVNSPDILLLDEPTNHLDIGSIMWMEQFLINSGLTLVFVTHDREFLKKVATRIVEVDRTNIFSYDCDYEKYLQRRDAMLDAEEKQNQKFDKKLSEEEAWIRRGIKARGRRNMGRVRELKELRKQRSQRRQRIGSVKMELTDSQISGQKVIVAKDISLKYEEAKEIFKDFSTVIIRGDRIGIIGPNGCGKTTLINTLLGKLKASTGEIKHGENLEIAYFDQLHSQLNLEKSVVENISGGPTEIEINGRRKHIFGYLQEFLFTPDRAKQEVGRLSGGERNRLLLAKLFMQPSNVLILDEPTNDLDAETLDMLEECIANYSGTVLTVSHDRYFLNNVVTSIIAFDGDGEVREYDGGYDDYIRQSAKYQKAAEEVPPAKEKPKIKPKPATTPEPKKKRRNFKEKFELEALPEKIETLETKKANLEAKLCEPDFYKRPGDEISAMTAELNSTTAELEEAYERWDHLESLDD